MLSGCVLRQSGGLADPGEPQPRVPTDLTIGLSDPMPVPIARPACERCRRPLSACWCTELQPVDTATRVVILQHPREAKVAIGTARIALLGLARSELHRGTDFARHARVAEIVAQPGTALLFPG